jgi:hypothetical protein
MWRSSAWDRREHDLFTSWNRNSWLEAQLLFLLQVSKMKFSLLCFVRMTLDKEWQCIMHIRCLWQMNYYEDGHIYSCLCLYIYDSKRHNGKCHFLWIMDALELSYTKARNRSICAILLLAIPFFKMALRDVFIANGVHVLMLRISEVILMSDFAPSPTLCLHYCLCFLVCYRLENFQAVLRRHLTVYKYQR